MATYTAQILIGSSHTYHGGIQPFGALYLSENSRSAWILAWNRSSMGLNEPFREIVWVTNPEYMIEEALIMILVHLLEHKKFYSHVETNIPKLLENWVDLTKDIKPRELQLLYNRLKEVDDFPKLVVSILEGSSLRSQWENFKQYNMELELLLLRYIRSYNPFTGEMNERNY
jgi:hypothetical protein